MLIGGVRAAGDAAGCGAWWWRTVASSVGVAGGDAAGAAGGVTRAAGDAAGAGAAAAAGVRLDAERRRYRAEGLEAEESAASGRREASCVSIESISRRSGAGVSTGAPTRACRGG